MCAAQSTPASPAEGISSIEKNKNKARSPPVQRQGHFLHRVSCLFDRLLFLLKPNRRAGTLFATRLVAFNRLRLLLKCQPKPTCASKLSQLWRLRGASALEYFCTHPSVKMPRRPKRGVRKLFGGLSQRTRRCFPAQCRGRLSSRLQPPQPSSAHRWTAANQTRATRRLL